MENVMYDNKALGVLFNRTNDEDSPYEWDETNITELVKNMGYEDYEEIVKELIHYNSPGNEDEMLIMRTFTGDDNLKVEDITIGMYVENIKKEFPL